MTISTTTAYSGPYSPNGSTTSFPFTFKAMSADEVEVVRISATATVTISPTLYTVALVGEGGTVTFSVAPATGDPLYVRSIPNFQQQIDLTNQGAFLPDVIEQGFDRAAIRDIWLLNQIRANAKGEKGDKGDSGAEGPVLTTCTVSTLPSPTPPRMAYVSDAANDAGTGAGVLAYSDGTTWRTIGGNALTFYVSGSLSFHDTPATFTDTAVNIDRTSHIETSSLARVVYTTNATSIKINGFTDIYGNYPQWAELGLVVDGVYKQSIPASANGTFNATVSGLAAGTKTIQIINGLQSRPSTTVVGTYLVSVDANAPLTRVTPAVGNRKVFLVDSIGVGANSTIPTRDSYISWLRKSTTDSIVVYGWGFDSLDFMAGDNTKTTALMALLTPLAPATIVNTLGTNDYGYVQTTAATFQSAYAALNDAIHAALPSATILAVTPISRSTETANTAGSNLPAFRTAINNAKSGKSWVTVVDGTAFMTTSYLTDGVHPGTYGHWLWAQGISGSLGYTVGSFLSAPITAGPDLNGTVTNPSAGVYRMTKSGGADAYDTGFVGQPQTGDFRYMIDATGTPSFLVGLNANGLAGSSYTDMSTQIAVLGTEIRKFDGATDNGVVASFIAGERIWVDRTGTTMTYRKGPNFVDGMILRTDTVSGTVSLDVSVRTIGAVIDITPNAGAGSPASTALPMYVGPDTANGTVTFPGGGVSRMTKTGGGASFSTGGFFGPNRNGDFRYSVTVPALCQAFIGVDVAPGDATIYTAMDHSVFLQAGGAINIYDAATDNGAAGTYAAGDVFWVDRTGSTITWKKGATYSGGTTVRTATQSGGVGMDFQIYTVGVVLDALCIS